MRRIARRVARRGVLAGEDDDGGRGGEHAVQEGEVARVLVRDAERDVAEDADEQRRDEHLDEHEGRARGGRVLQRRQLRSQREAERRQRGGGEGLAVGVEELLDGFGQPRRAGDDEERLDDGAGDDGGDERRAQQF